MAGKGVTARARAAKSRRLKLVERDRMQDVREREDYTCRFPHRCGITPEVSHQRHRGMGGDPSGECSDPRIMIAVCHVVHRTGRIALDRKNLRWVALTPAGADGPIEWQVKLGAVPGFVGGADDWIRVAVEGERGQLLPPLEVHRLLLAAIGKANA